MSYLSVMAERAERLLPIPKGLHRFLAVGLVGLFVHTGIFTLLTMGAAWAVGWRVPDSVAWLVALFIATSITWTLNRKLTFAASGRKLHHEAFRYILVTLVAQSVSFAVFHAMLTTAKGVPAPFDVVAGAAAATIFSYAGNRFFTFAPPAPRPGKETL